MYVKIWNVKKYEIEINKVVKKNKNSYPYININVKLKQELYIIIIIFFYENDNGSVLFKKCIHAWMAPTRRDVKRSFHTYSFVIMWHKTKTPKHREEKKKNNNITYIK